MTYIEALQIKEQADLFQEAESVVGKHDSLPAESALKAINQKAYTETGVAATAHRILNDVMQFRRRSDPNSSCSGAACVHCSSPHLSKVLAAVASGQPVTFVLPAFPGKSPNQAKVLGPLPDRAEQCALEFLQHLCDRIETYYVPGAKIILCSDGRVFSDVVGIHDQAVTDYQLEISRMIEALDLKSISTFNLEELYKEVDFDRMRSLMMQQYGEPIEMLKAAVRRGKEFGSSIEDQEFHRLYLGITRFLFEDSLYPGQKQSRTGLQKESRGRAYTVIQRSKAWGELVEGQFPDAVRLSIHPQSCGSKKLGIKLIEPDNWATPWHGVAVLVDGRFLLMKRSQAESLGAQLVMRFGRPSHYILKRNDRFIQLSGVPDET